MRTAVPCLGCDIPDGKQEDKSGRFLNLRDESLPAILVQCMDAARMNKEETSTLASRSDAKALGPLWYRAKTQNQLRSPTLYHVSSPHASPCDRFLVHELSRHNVFDARFVKIAGFLVASLDHIRKGCRGRVDRSKPRRLLDEVLTWVDETGGRSQWPVVKA